MFDANTTIHTEPQFVLHKTSIKLQYTYACSIICFFLFTVLKRNITCRYTVVHKKSSASFLFFLHVSKRQDRHFIVSQNAPTSEPCFTVSLIFRSPSFLQDTLRTIMLNLQRRTHVMWTSVLGGDMFLSTK